ncbi:hypothetical protein ACEZCY_35775 [Streptacidiphilus sp. N1-12]|uniref:Uncharacterized protein n=1 Tax=Streptacidiphilus alkalitolerans TaxID=3342712 RepID=A0ABV6WR73_9ACTN
MSDHQARRNAARRLMRETGVNYQAAVLQVAVTDNLPSTAPAEQAAATEHLSPALCNLVRAHCWKISRDLDRAMNETRMVDHLRGEEPRSRSDRAEWERIVLYSLSDAARRLNLLLGTLAVDVQARGADSELLQRFLQTEDEAGALAYLTDDAREHHAGLTGGSAPESTMAIWHAVGAVISENAAPPDRDPLFDMTECFLAALHGDPQEDPQIFDGFAPNLKALAMELVRRRKREQRKITHRRMSPSTGG